MSSLRFHESGFDHLHTQATGMLQHLSFSVTLIEGLQQQASFEPQLRASYQQLLGNCFQLQSKIQRIDGFVQDSKTLYRQVDNRLSLQINEFFNLAVPGTIAPVLFASNPTIGYHQKHSFQTYVLNGQIQWNGIFQHNQGMKPLTKGTIIEGKAFLDIAGASYQNQIANMKLQGDVSLGHIDAFGKSHIALTKDGVFDPSLSIDVGANASLAHGKIGLDWNRDWIGASANASGELGSVDAKGTLDISKKGIHIEGDVGAAMAKGKISGSLELFGFTFTATAHGEAGAVGIGGKFVAESNSFEIGAKASCLFGGGVDFKIDW